MVLTINKWGNSQGIRLPKDLLNKLHVTVGMALNAEVLNGKIIIEPVTPKKYIISMILLVKLSRNMGRMKSIGENPKVMKYGNREFHSS